jgi:soluble lytic murein transglycosylase
MKNKRSKPVLTFFMIIILLLLVLGVIAVLQPVFYPLKYVDEVKVAAKESSLDPYLLLAIIKEESGFDPEAHSAAGAEGLMQLMPDTADWIIEQMDLNMNVDTAIWDAGLNIRMGAWYLNWLTNRYYEGNLLAAIAAYNAGMQNVDSWLKEGDWDGGRENIGDIPYPETRDYIHDVLRNYDIYRKIYGDRL